MSNTLAKIGLSINDVRRGIAQCLVPTVDEVRRFTGKSLKGQTGRRGLPDHIVDAMYADYERLQSLSKVGALWQRTRQAMYDIFRRAKKQLQPRPFQQKVIWHDRPFTLSKDGYRDTLGTRERLHKLIWQARTGRKIPHGWQVGFKDADHSNFAFSNLFCAPQAEVSSYHQRRIHPSARLSPEDRRLRRNEIRRQYMAHKAAKFVAMGLRTDGRPRRRTQNSGGASSVEPLIDIPSPPRPSRYERMKAELGVAA